jgi:PEP-CTERM motif
MKLHSALLIGAIALIPTAVLADGSTPLSPFVLTTNGYAQNFNTLATTGTSSSLPAGFQVVELGTGAAADGLFAAGTGSSNAGNSYSFGATGSTERALGSLGSAGVSTVYLGGIFTNGLAATITSLAIAFGGEQWRAGTSTDDKLAFEFSLNATALNNGTWTAFSALDFAPTVLSGDIALNGNANSVAIASTLTGLSIISGSSFGFRWVDVNSTGNDHGLAIDNLSIDATTAAVNAVPEPGTWALMLAGFGIVGFAMRRSMRRTLSIA